MMTNVRKPAPRPAAVKSAKGGATRRRLTEEERRYLTLGETVMEAVGRWLDESEACENASGPEGEQGKLDARWVVALGETVLAVVGLSTAGLQAMTKLLACAAESA
jgi:hypothetical protein